MKKYISNMSDILLIIFKNIIFIYMDIIICKNVIFKKIIIVYINPY